VPPFSTWPRTTEDKNKDGQKTAWDTYPFHHVLLLSFGVLYEKKLFEIFTASILLAPKG